MVYLTNDGRRAVLTIDPQGGTSNAPLLVQQTEFEGSIQSDLWELHSVHFHWKGEHQIESTEAEMEIQFIHFNLKYGVSLQDVIDDASDQNDAIAIVSIMVDEASPSINNDAYEVFLNSLRRVYATDESSETSSKAPLNTLFPTDTLKFYSYSGSWTTPEHVNNGQACLEMVKWFIFEEFVELSACQISRFYNMLTDTSGTPDQTIDANNRPLQDLNSRPIIHADLIDDCPDGSTCNWVPTGLQDVIVLGGASTSVEDFYLPRNPDSFDYISKTSCGIASYFEFTARDETMQDGVYDGMICDYVHGKAICCGGRMGNMGPRWLVQDDCGYLEGANWVSFDEMPEALYYASAAPVIIDGVNYWMVSGGDSEYTLARFARIFFDDFFVDQERVAQTTMYLLDDSLAWSTSGTALPEPMVGHCTVQINDDTIAFIGGVTSATNINAETRSQIYVLTNGAWSYGPDLPADVERGGNLGCYLVPDDENLVVFGCAQGGSNPAKAYVWDIANNSTSEVAECPIKSVDFHILDDNSTIVATGSNRNIYSFDHSSGFTRLAGNPRLTLAHGSPRAMLVPRQTATCNN